MEPTRKKRARTVRLRVDDYSLGSPDFAKPALTQTHGLAAADFTTGALDFGYSEPSQNHRLEQRRQRTGRPPAIPTDAVRDMLIGQMTEWLREERAKARRRLRPGDRKVEVRMMWLAGQANVDASYFILKREVVRPAFQKAFPDIDHR